MSTLFLFPFPDALNVEFVTVAEFFPSITIFCAPLAFPFESSNVILPVEYIIGEPLPCVDKLEFFAITVPSPLSVARVAQLPHLVEIVTLSASIYPPYVASNPLELSLLVFIVVSFIYIFAFSPVANTAFDPFESV